MDYTYMPFSSVVLHTTRWSIATAGLVKLFSLARKP